MDHIQEFIRVTEDIIELSKYPLNDINRSKGSEIVRIFNHPGYGTDTAKEFFDEYYNPLQIVYKRYFDIFSIPPFTSLNSATFRYNLLYTPLGFKNDFNEFIIKYKIRKYEDLFLHLIAEIVDFINNPRNCDIFKHGLTHVKESSVSFVRDMTELSRLKEYLMKNEVIDDDFGVSLSKLFRKKKACLTLSFSDNEFLFRTPNLLYDLFFNDIAIKQKQAFHLSENQIKQYVKDAFPPQNNFQVRFQRNLVCALHLFITHEVNSKDLVYQIVGIEEYKMISSFFRILNFPFDHRYAGKTNNDDYVIPIIKTWIHRIR